MPKKILQDIKKIKYEIRNELPKELQKEIPSSREERPESRLFSRPTFYNPEPIEEENKPRYTLWLVALVSVVFLFFAISFLFSGAKISVNPKMNDIVLNEDLSATKDSNGAGLSFNLMSIAGEETKVVQVTEQKDVSIKALGTVVIFNTFSSSPQPLNIDTRLEGSNGKLYKTTEKIVVPGMSKDGKPGSVEVGIYGSEAGEGYNSAPLDFKIFGFKGTSKYSKIYARSKGDITGGLMGKLYQVSDTEKEIVIKELTDTLEAKLLKKVTEQIPGEFVLFKDAVFIEIENNNFNFTSTDVNVPITIKGTLYGFLFNEKKLTKQIVETGVSNYDGSDVYISNLRSLKFNLANKDISLFKDMKEINFNLSGNAKIVWTVDTAKLTSNLLGKSKKDFNQILSEYPNITSADLVIKPAWKSSFPEKSKDIKVIVNYPE
ncbi:MAG: hypothetical protein WA101_03175 [Minisyncoccia bacterium]